MVANSYQCVLVVIDFFQSFHASDIPVSAYYFVQIIHIAYDEIFLK